MFRSTSRRPFAFLLLAFVGLFCAGCALLEEDEITGRRDPAASDAAPVPGADPIPPNAQSAGWR